MSRLKTLILVLPIVLTAFKCTRHEEQLDIINISNTRGRSEYPAIAADSRGYFYVVWEERLFSRESLFIYLAIRDPSGEWTAPEKIFELQWAAFPKIAIDQHNTIHVIWRDTDEHGWGEVLYTKKRLGCTWTEPETISVYGLSCVPDFAVDNAGNVHLVWLEWVGNFYQPIYYAKRATSGSWSMPLEISSGNAFLRSWPHVVASSENQAHIVWEEAQEDIGPELTMYSTNVTNDSFGQPEAIYHRTSYLDAQTSPTIAIDYSGAVHVVWNAHADVFYTSKEPYAEWLIPTRICSTEDISMRPNIVSDVDGSVRVAWFEGGQQLGFTLTNGEHEWSTARFYPIDIMGLMTPKPAIGINSVGIAFSATWELEPSGNDNTEIFFVEVPTQ